jgi:hypothetical protein
MSLHTMSVIICQTRADLLGAAPQEGSGVCGNFIGFCETATAVAYAILKAEKVTVHAGREAGGVAATAGRLKKSG